MARRTIKLREKDETAQDIEQEVISPRTRPEAGRFLLQVDRQTKSSYVTGEAAEEAGRIIKKGYPVVQVAVYDTVESVHKIVEL
jgi:hypothetical protein